MKNFSNDMKFKEWNNNRRSDLKSIGFETENNILEFRETFPPGKSLTYNTCTLGIDAFSPSHLSIIADNSSGVIPPTP